jgi:hypothetical protein
MDLEKRIREIAHDLWVAEGYPSGQHDRHWRMATQMAKEEAEQSACELDETLRKRQNVDHAFKQEAIPETRSNGAREDELR